MIITIAIEACELLASTDITAWIHYFTSPSDVSCHRSLIFSRPVISSTSSLIAIVLSAALKSYFLHFFRTPLLSLLLPHYSDQLPWVDLNWLDLFHSFILYCLLYMYYNSTHDDLEYFMLSISFQYLATIHITCYSCRLLFQLCKSHWV